MNFRSSKADEHTYIKQITPHINALIERRIKELGLTKVQLSIQVTWKKQEKQVIQLDPEDLGIQEDQELKVYKVIVEKVLKSEMMEIFQGNNVEE